MSCGDASDETDARPDRAFEQIKQRAKLGVQASRGDMRWLIGEVDRIRDIHCEVINERNMRGFRIDDLEAEVERLRAAFKPLLASAIDRAASEQDWAEIKAAEEALGGKQAGTDQASARPAGFPVPDDTTSLATGRAVSERPTQ